MTRLRLAPACLSLALAFAGAAHAADSYYIDGYRGSCGLGSGGQGVVTVGPSYFSVGETYYTRVGARKTLAGGWQRATWSCESEGDDCGRARLDLRITAAEVAVRGNDLDLVARRCPA